MKEKFYIFLGPPGAGKGTQAKYLADKFNFHQISTGDILRYNVDQGTELGKIAHSYISEGKLVPDDIILDLVKDYLGRFRGQVNGFIFDGFPRTIDQAEGLNEILQENQNKIDKVIYFNVDEQTIIARNINRRVCPKCKKVYNLLVKPPEHDLLCDICQVELVQREDDKPDVISDRLNVYKAKTEPLIDFYKQTDKFVEINGQLSVEQVAIHLEKEINGI
ncbi:MAG: adenylate kinase [bacterium]